MVVDHDAALAASGVSLAIIDVGETADTVAEPFRQADVVHRHLHRIAGQAPGARWRYSLRSRLPPRTLT